MLLIIDSNREANLKFGAGFTDERVGDSEVMLSTNTMNYLNVSALHKDKIDLYFDFMQLMRTVYSVTDGEFGSTVDAIDTNVFKMNSTNTTEEVEQIDRDVNKEINEALRQLLPSAEEIIKIMKEDFDVNITESNTVKIDV